MKRPSITSIKKPLLLLGVLTFFFAGFLGMAHASMGMYDSMSTLSATAENTPMPGCLLSGILHTNTPCQMNPLEHIAEWQYMLSAVPPQKSIFLFFALFFFVLAVYIAGRRFGMSCVESARSAIFRGRFFEPAIFDRPLQEAFSNGIVHPKIF